MSRILSRWRWALGASALLAACGSEPTVEEESKAGGWLSSVLGAGTGVSASGSAEGTPSASVAPVAAERPEVVRSAVLSALTALPAAEVPAWKGEVPYLVRGKLGSAPGFARSGRSADANMDAELRGVLRQVAPVFRLSESELMLRSAKADAQGRRHLRYRQVEHGLPVIGGDFVMHIDTDGTVYAANSTARGGGAVAPPQPTQAAERAAEVALATAAEAGKTVKAEGEPRLVYFSVNKGEALELAWEVQVVGQAGSEPVRDLVYVDAHRARTLAVHPQVHSALYRRVATAGNNTWLPGFVQRTEGEGETGDQHVDLNYARLFAAYTCYSRYFGRDSFDNDGGSIESTVHYDTNYNNAFSNGSRLVFGDGDGTTFSPLGEDRDIVIHEFSHLVTDSESDLVYANESGALNEAFSDIMAAFCASDMGTTWEMNNRVWFIAEASRTPTNTTDALRYMNDPDRGGDKDWYPSRQQPTSNPSNANDHGGVHTNSGIANLAFVLLSQGGPHPRGRSHNNVPGIGIEAAGRIFYKAYVDYFTSTTGFHEAMDLTEQAARDLGYGDAVANSVRQAWLAVGVTNGVKGHVESITPNGGMQGWAFDAQSPADTMELHYYVNGPWDSGIFHSGTTTVFRSDVNAANGLTGNHGFSLPIPAQFYDGVTHSLWVYGIDKQGESNSPIDGFDAPFIGRATFLSFTFNGAEGHVDEVTVDGYIRGWALDLQSKGTSIPVHYYVDGPAGSGAPGFAIATDQARPDVNSAYGASGTHGFRFRLPTQYHDGYPHRVYVYAIDAQGRHNPLIDGTSYFAQVGETPEPPDDPVDPCDAKPWMCDPD